MQRILDNIYLVKSSLSISNQYIITFNNFVLLIDTGLRGNSSHILACIRELGFKKNHLK